MPEHEKLYDTEILVQTHNADQEFILYMITLFVKHVPETTANLEKACGESSWERVHFYAHKLKASIDLFNLVPLKDLVRKVEQNALKFVNTETIPADVNVIADYIRNCVAAMKQEFKLD
jgi:hypothetical protein